MITEDAIRHLDSVQEHEIERYTRYLGRIKPNSHEDQFKRWIFAYASVHTSWQMNCRLYQALEDLKWVGNRDELHSRIVACRAGMHNNRTRFISEFSEFYWDHPDWFKKCKHENWFKYRDRIQNVALGIGQAKSAFTVEMTYPFVSDVICVDTHMLQLYGNSPNKSISKKNMNAIEEHWAEECRARNIPPVIGRWIYWDNKAGQSDPRFWSFVFEEENYNVRLAKLASSTGRRADMGGHIGQTDTGAHSPVPSMR